ncbi:MAG: ATP-grasp domain-containing protein [Chitinophagales bacterium]|nr:ATP-grasp domain-containing protein [Chitinophagales bacterium]
MYFLVQSNIYSDPDHHRIFAALDELNIDYETIELLSTDESVSVQQDRQDVFVYGSVKLARLAKQNTNWYPGSFYGGNHLFEVYAKHYTNHLLNYSTEIFKFGDKLKWEMGETKFIKPYEMAKLFTGKVFYESEWNDFVEENTLHPRTPLLTPSSLMQASVPQHIIKEARLWIVGKQVVQSVYYRFHGDIVYESDVSIDGIEFAKEMIALFNVAEAFVMDICLTYDGWKIVEINCINSAGFFPKVDVKTLIKTLNIYFSK